MANIWYNITKGGDIMKIILVIILFSLVVVGGNVMAIDLNFLINGNQPAEINLPSYNRGFEEKEETFTDKLLKLLFGSALETDRIQSYDWHFATKDNPAISPNGYHVYEA